MKVLETVNSDSWGKKKKNIFAKLKVISASAPLVFIIWDYSQNIGVWIAFRSLRVLLMLVLNIFLKHYIEKNKNPESKQLNSVQPDTSLGKVL